MPKQNQAQTQYLANSGALDSGDPARIAAAKREYRRLYQRAYKQRYRAIRKDVRFTLEKQAMSLLLQAASREQLKCSSLAKQIVLSWLEGNKHLENMPLRRELLQEITIIGSHIRQLCRHQPKGLMHLANYRKLSERVDELERQLREILLSV